MADQLTGRRCSTFPEIAEQGRSFIVVNRTGSKDDPARDPCDTAQPVIYHGPFPSRESAERCAKNGGFRTFDIHVLYEPLVAP